MTIEKKTQLAALNAQGKSIEEISKLSGVNAADVEAFLMTRGAVPGSEKAQEPKKRTYNRMTPTLLEKAVKLRAEGLTCAMIADQLGINQKTVEYHMRKIKAEQTKKEPAQAATCTDSEAVIGNDNTNSLCLNDTTDRAESQALEAAKKKLLEIYETLTPEECRAWDLGEVYAEVVRGCRE
jgi:hypothetical protein